MGVFNVNNAQFSFVLNGKCKLDGLLNNSFILTLWHYDNLFCYQSWDEKSYYLNSAKRKMFTMPVTQYVNAFKNFNKNNPQNPYNPTIILKIPGQEPSFFTVTDMNIHPYSSDHMDESLQLTLEFNYDKISDPNQIMSLSKQNNNQPNSLIFTDSLKMEILFSKFGYKDLNYNNYLSINNLPFTPKEQKYDARWDISAVLALKGKNVRNLNYLIQDRCKIRKIFNKQGKLTGFGTEMNDPDRPFTQYQTWSEFSPLENSINHKKTAYISPTKFSILLNQHNNYLKEQKAYYSHASFGYEPTCLITLRPTTSDITHKFIGVLKRMDNLFNPFGKFILEFSTDQIVGRGSFKQSPNILSEGLEYIVEVIMDGILHENPNGYEVEIPNVINSTSRSTSTVSATTPGPNNQSTYNFPWLTLTNDETTQINQLNSTQLCNLNNYMNTVNKSYTQSIQSGQSTTYAAQLAQSELTSLLNNGLNGTCSTPQINPATNKIHNDSNDSNDMPYFPPWVLYLLSGLKSYLASHPPPSKDEQFVKQLVSTLEFGPIGILQFVALQKGWTSYQAYRARKKAEQEAKDKDNNTNPQNENAGQGEGEAAAEETAATAEAVAGMKLDSVFEATGFSQMVTSCREAAVQAGEDAVKDMPGPGAEGYDQAAYDSAYNEAYNAKFSDALNNYTDPATGSSAEDILNNTFSKMQTALPKPVDSADMPPEAAGPTSEALEMTSKSASETLADIQESYASGGLSLSEAVTRIDNMSSTMVEDTGEAALDKAAETIAE